MYEKINALPIQDILDKLGIEYRIRGIEIELYDEGKVTDGWRGSTELNIITSFSARGRAQGSPYNFVKSHLNIDDRQTFIWFEENFQIERDKKVFRKRETYLLDPPQDPVLPILRRFTEFRGIKSFPDTLASELYAEQKLYIDKDIYKDTLFFPMYDENKNRIGMKMRTVDGTEFPKIGKSGNIKGGHSGCIYSDISTDEVIICEGEVDYLSLKALGFTSVIGNLGGVSACKDILLKLCRHTKRIIIAYDNDLAGRSAIIDFGKPVEYLQYPDGTEGCDINDLVKRGFEKKDFKTMMKKEQPLYMERFLYDNKSLEIFDVKDRRFVTKPKVCEFVLQNTRVVDKDPILPTYNGLCYRQGGRNGSYNLFREDSLLTPSDTPELSPEIEFLFNNLCNYDEKNIDWLISAIAFKYRNINEVRIPAVLFFGPGSTGKGLFLKLIVEIFGEENCILGLNSYAIDGRFSPDTSCSLIIEYKEVVTTNMQDGKKVMNTLKSRFMEEKISLEKKGRDIEIVDNIAWNILSSNEPRALVLDSADSGNRRFSIIKTSLNPISLDEGGKIAESIKKTAGDFLAYILDKYPPVSTISALQNEDKDNLESLSQSYSGRFFDWFEDKYPEINRITIQERNILINNFEKEEPNGTDLKDTSFYRNFNNSLPHRVKSKKEKGNRGYTISKQGRGFTDEETYNLIK